MPNQSYNFGPFHPRQFCNVGTVSLLSQWSRNQGSLQKALHRALTLASGLVWEQMPPPEIKSPPSPQQPAASEVSSTPLKPQRACVSHRDVGGAPPPLGTRSGRAGGRPFCEAASELFGCGGLREAVRAGAIGRGAEALARGVTRVWVLVPRKLSPVRLPQPRNGRGSSRLLGAPGRGLPRPRSPRLRAPYTKGSLRGYGGPGVPLTLCGLRGCERWSRRAEVGTRL